MSMSRIVLVAAFAAAVLASSVPARAAEGPWCALLNMGSDLSEDCQYHSLEQCLPAVSGGFRGFCNPNPRWHGAEEPRKPRRKHLSGQY
jgi:Protein of unknown function (DUF3551)